ncbi:MAG: hypothetical protein ACOYON_07665 [Fimbriimonas sp.]
MKYSWFALLASFLALTGCGGGLSPAGDTGGTDRVYGPISTRSIGPVAEPVFMQGSLSSVTGVFGANFLNATVALPPENQLNEISLLNTTMLFYSDTGRPVAME